jgi:hypothetical protein
MAEEHYLAFTDVRGLIHAVRFALSTPERVEVVRAVGMARAAELAQPRRYLDLFETLRQPGRAAGADSPL